MIITNINDNDNDKHGTSVCSNFVVDVGGV